MVTNSLHMMREALESIRNLAFEVQDMNGEGDVKASLPPKWVIDIVNFALSEPPRQCDVGTAEEHAQRFHDFCVGNSSGINGMCKPTCPCIDCFDKCQCFAKWAQTPYEQKGAVK